MKFSCLLICIESEWISCLCLIRGIFGTNWYSHGPSARRLPTIADIIEIFYLWLKVFSIGPGKGVY